MWINFLNITYRILLLHKITNYFQIWDRLLKYHPKMANDCKTLNMRELIRNLHDTPEGQSMSDVTFLLKDGTELQAHKLILAAASPYFKAQFYGPWDKKEPVKKIEDVEADVFRVLIEKIYDCRYFDDDEKEKHADRLILIMEAADMYDLPYLVDMMADEVTICARDGTFKNLLPHLDRLQKRSHMPRFAALYKTLKKCIICYLPEELGLWEKLGKVQKDVEEDMRKIPWEESAEECQRYIHLLSV